VSRITRYILLFGLMSALGGCSSVPVVTSDIPVQVVGGNAPVDLTDTGQPPSFSQLIAQLLQARVVYVGERHDSYPDHQIQLAIIQSLHDSDAKVAIGLEWFQRPFQRHLDDYIAGLISEAELLRRSQFFHRWGGDYRHYRPIIRYAREQRIPLIALNAPSELVNAIMRDGIKSLDEPLIEHLPEEYFFTNQVYKQRLKQIYRQHKGFSASFSNFYEVQLTWDETMSEEISRFLDRDSEETLVVLAGSGHLEYGDGIPERVERRTAIVGKILLPFHPEIDDPLAAHHLLSTPRGSLPARGEMGLALRHDNQQPIIVKLDHVGPARQAGLRQGDRITHIDEQPIEDLTDLQLALLDKLPGDQVALRIRRGHAGKRQLNLRLSPPGRKTGGHL
jgi:uncharacterized iron-regulated protein